MFPPDECFFLLPVEGIEIVRCFSFATFVALVDVNFSASHEACHFIVSSVSVGALFY